MHELHSTRIDDLYTHFVIRTPQNVHTRLGDGIETSVDPDQCTLGVLQVQHNGVVANEPRTDDEIDILVIEPHLTRTDDIETQLEQRIELPVRARLQDCNEVALAKEQTTLMITNLELANHGDLLFFVYLRRISSYAPFAGILVPV